jgi:hypothetical protein
VSGVNRVGSLWETSRSGAAAAGRARPLPLAFFEGRPTDFDFEGLAAFRVGEGRGAVFLAVAMARTIYRKLA